MCESLVLNPWSRLMGMGCWLLFPVNRGSVNLATCLSLPSSRQTLFLRPWEGLTTGHCHLLPSATPDHCSVSPMPSPTLETSSCVEGLPQPGHGARHLLLLPSGPAEEAALPGLAACLLSTVAANGLHRGTLRGTHSHPPGPGLCRSGRTPAPGDTTAPLHILTLPCSSGRDTNSAVSVSYPVASI